MQIISDDWNRMLKSVKKGASTSADYYTNCRYLYGVISDFQYKYRFFGTGTIIKTKEIILMERKGLQQLYDIIAEKFEKAAEAGALEIGTSPENAAYMLVQSCMVASRNPEMNFKDLWGFLHVREGSADAQQCAPPMKR